MANTHPANLGDVLKHIVLCEALQAQPATYIDSHAGAFSYDLADAPGPGPGGIWEFGEMARTQPDLAGSAYAGIVLPMAGTPQSPGTYPGSLMLADHLLPPNATIVAAETNPGTAAMLSSALQRTSRRFELPGDPLEGQDVVSSMAGPDSLVLIDPFDVHERSSRGLSSLDAFCQAAQRGVSTFLWYPLVDPDEGTEWVPEVLGAAGLQPLQLEIRYPEKAAGLWGCGLVAVHVEPNVHAGIAAMWATLQEALVARSPGYEFFMGG